MTDTSSPNKILDRVSYDLVDQIAYIELAHGPHNSLDLRMGVALCTASLRASHDVASGAARVVVVGAQGSAFSIGGDLAEFSAADDRGAQVKATAEALHAALATLRSLDVPVVSVISGTTAGGGLGLALVGDIVIAAAEAKLVMAYTASGLSPDCGLTWTVPRRLPWPQAMDLALTNRVLTGAEAADWGLVSRAVPRDALDEAVRTLVSSLRDGPAGALADTKRLMAQSMDRTLGHQLDEEAVTLARNIAGPDGIEGVDAFLAKRKATYR